ncbi:unnamed protein product [Schistosoma margrebowiei]|uniref:non-specific serine/threonine protein kinase n=1 Tax=Schistosoma margrebowiei TaxID=48269 RepID=A0AA85A0H9_9TREM|nr:unnamed protein product [Schistosoma margrebowiei]
MAVRSELSEQKLGYIREFVNNKDPKEEYKLIQSIGTGTYGEVYKAIRLRTKEFAAVKIIKVDAKDDVRAILQEIQTLRECRHCNIVQFFGSYFRNNKLWICMEFCGGFSMQDIYTNIQRPIEENCIAFVSRETLRGIEYMHKAGKIHRDIKGANILLTTDGDVKIADFGVAAQITQTIQRRNSFIGTPYWMAPEVAAVERKGGYDEKCDVWALGITAIEYAELQPPLFDLHPMRALRILGMRSYKPPVLRNKSLWSQKFHNFLKASLTKSEKKRPTAQALLRHEFVNQPHLTRLLTLKLLETNRNPNITTAAANNNNNNRLSVHANNSTNQQKSHIKEVQIQEEYSALLAGRPDYPMVMNKLPVQSPNEEYKDRTLVRSHNVPQISSADNQSSSDIKRPITSTSSNRPEPLIKMHTPWQSQQMKSDQLSPINLSKPTTTIAEVIVQKSSIISPMERIQSARPQQFLIEHSIINDGNALNNKLNIDKLNSNYHPSTSKSILEEIRIMDELPTPFPAYVASAPTATPAVKPPGLSYQLNNSTSKHIENVIQKTPTSSYSSGISQPLYIQTTTYDISSTTMVDSHKNNHHLQPQPQHRRSSSNNSSSISSASTSPRSSFSSSQLDLLDPVSTDLTSGSHQTTILSNSNSSSPTSPGSGTSSSSSSSSSTSSSVSAEAAVVDDDLNGGDEANILISTVSVEHKSDIVGVDDDVEEVFLNEDKDLKIVDKQQDEKEETENYKHQEYLAITEHTIIQDSLEARFLPIDSEPHVVESHSVHVAHHNVSPENGDHLCRVTDTVTQSVAVSKTITTIAATTTTTKVNGTNAQSNDSSVVEFNKSVNLTNASNHDNIPKSISIDDYTKAEKHRNDQQYNRQHLSISDHINYDNNGEEDDLNDIVHYTPERISPMSFDRGTVTTIESHLSSIMAQDEIDDCRDNTNNNKEFDYSSSKKIIADSEKLSESPPYACLDVHNDNPDEWDLGVADRDLLAADGLLYLDRSHPESLSDRISEFGFRIHGSSEGEEDLEDEDDDQDDSGIRDEIIIPNDLSNINMMNLCQLSSNTNNIEGISPTLSRMNTNDNSMDTISTQKLSLTTNDGTNLNSQITNGDLNLNHMDVLNKNTKFNSTMTNTTTSTTTTNNNHNNRLVSQKELDLNDIVNSTGHEFYPEKSGEELMSLLRQLKFAQKFAWLSGASVLPTGLSALTNIQSNKLTSNNNNNLDHHCQSLTNGITNELYTKTDTLNIMKDSSTIKTMKQDKIDNHEDVMKLDTTIISTVVTINHDEDKQLTNEGITFIKHNHLNNNSILLNGDNSKLNQMNGKLNDIQNDDHIDDDDDVVVNIKNDKIDNSFVKQKQNGLVYDKTDVIINGQINDSFDGSELPLFVKDNTTLDNDSSIKSDMKLNLETISTSYKPDNISLSTKHTIDIPTPIITTTVCSINNNNNSNIQPHSSAVSNTLTTSTVTTDNHLKLLMMNMKDYVQVSSSLPSTPVSSSVVPANFNVIPTIDNNNNNDKTKSESDFQMTKLSELEKQDIAYNKDNLSVKNYTSLPSGTSTAYPSDVVITKKCTTTTGTIDLICSKSTIMGNTHTTYPINSNIITTTSPTIGLLTKPAPISISTDIHPIDSDDIEVDDIVYSNMSNERKSYIGGSLQLIPQREEKNTNRKKLFYRSSLSPCSDIHPFPSSTSLVTGSLPKTDDQEICSNDYQKIANSVIPSSTLLTSPITDTETIRTTASISYLPSNQPLALQPHLKMVSSIELSGNLNGNDNNNNRSHNDNFSKDSPLVSSVKLHRRVPAPTVTSDVLNNSDTIATTISKIATSPALISSVINSVKANEAKISRSSMIELISCPNKDVSYPGQILSSIPPPLPSLTSSTPLSKPQGNMGACFSLVFEGCPLKINSTATWINPANNGQVILLGTNDGIYCLQLKGRSDNSLELLFPRRCLWLSVTRDTMMSLSGRHPQLYAHNLVSLMKLKSQGHSMSGSSGCTVGGSSGVSGSNISGLGGAASKFGKFVKLFPKRFSPSKKMPDTKGCLRANVTRNPFNGAKYLCAAMTNEILIMEWFNPVSSFIEIKRIFVPDMPSPLLNFDLLIVKNLPLPFVCVGVYRHHSRKGREGQRFRLHLIDLNSSGPNPPQMPPVVSSIPPPISVSSVAAAVSVTAMASTTSTTITTSTTTTNCVSPNHSGLLVDSSTSPHSVISHSENINGLNDSVELTSSNNNRLTNKTQVVLKSDQTKAELQRKNTLFLPEDILPVVETVQLEHNTILICFLDCAKVVSLNGQIKSSRHRATTLDFNGITVESIVCLRDSILVFHPHGLLGKSFTGELTQEINDKENIYRLLGYNRNIIVESRPANNPMSNSNVYILSDNMENI